MKIAEKTWVSYVTRLARLHEEAGRKMADYLARHGTRDSAALIDYAAALVQQYGEGSAELACQMYDALAAASGADLPPAEPASPADYGEAARMVNGTKQSPPLLQSGVSRLVKRTAADTTLKNAIRDGAQWAWVPHGDTCPFCLALASRGWQRASKKALQGDHAQHIHANCDCEYAVRFDSRTTVAGYDPDQYLAQYRAAGGDISAMRRAHYAQDKDTINAQKRAAYAARKLRESGGGGILEETGSRYLPITERSLDAVKPFACRSLDETGQQALAQDHRKLLQEAAAHPAGTEAARCYGLDMQPLGQTVIGTQPGKVRIPDQDVPYIAAHTHPSGMTFSPGDIRGFATRENMRMLTAVGNDGTVYAIEKTLQFDRNRILALFHDAENRLAMLQNQQEVNAAMQKLLKEAEQYGATFYAGGN